jgi:hypothetical protein
MVGSITYIECVLLSPRASRESQLLVYNIDQSAMRLGSANIRLDNLAPPGSISWLEAINALFRTRISILPTCLPIRYGPEAQT